MMKQELIDKMRRSSLLLPPPGGKVVRELLDKIEHLQNQSVAMSLTLGESDDDSTEA
jgi:hypothetical protein